MTSLHGLELNREGGGKTAKDFCACAQWYKRLLAAAGCLRFPLCSSHLLLPCRGRQNHHPAPAPPFPLSHCERTSLPTHLRSTKSRETSPPRRLGSKRRAVGAAKSREISLARPWAGGASQRRRRSQSSILARRLHKAVRLEALSSSPP